MNWPLLCNSLVVSGAATAAAVAGGAVAALFFAGLGGRWRRLLLAAAVAALVLPPFLAANCWIGLLGETGVWRRWLPLNIYSLGGTVWILALLNWPIAFLFVTAAWQRVQTAQLETDPFLRGGALLRWLLLPLARTALIQAAILTFVLTLNNFAVPAILQVKVFPAEVWVRFNTTFDYGAALALSWPLVLAPLALVLCFRSRATSWSWQSSQAAARSFRRQLGAPWHWSGGMAAVFLVVFSLGVPLWQLAGNRQTWHELWPALAAGHSAVIHSAAYAALTATLIVGLALMTRRMALGAALWLPFFMPGVLLGIALIWIFNRRGLEAIYQSAAIVILAYALRYAALGWNAVARALRATDRNLAAMARLEGATAWQTLRHVHWPQISAPLAAAWYVTWLLCLWDVETLVLIVPPGGESLSLRVFNLLHYGHNAQVNALCLLLMALALFPLLLAAAFNLLRSIRRGPRLWRRVWLFSSWAVPAISQEAHRFRAGFSAASKSSARAARGSENSTSRARSRWMPATTFTSWI